MAVFIFVANQMNYVEKPSKKHRIMKKIAFFAVLPLLAVSCSHKTVEQSVSRTSRVEANRVFDARAVVSVADSVSEDLDVTLVAPVVEVLRGDSVVARLRASSAVLSRRGESRRVVAAAVAVNDSARAVADVAEEAEVVEKPTSGRGWSWTWAVMGMLAVVAVVAARVSR